MVTLSVSSNHEYLLKDGDPFFYLADTAWMAFANLPLADWPRYLAYRKQQGFNALQISILPITNDNSVSDDNLDPFESGSAGNWDFSRYNEAYFEKAEAMLALAVEAGFIPVLGVLWCNYVPGSRCDKASPIASAMPEDAITPYATYAAERFKKYNPAFFISGDAGFESDQEEPYYLAALHAVKAVCPDALLTMHLRPHAELPHSFLELIDFYMYQSGHRAGQQDTSYRFAGDFRGYPVKHPVLNSEPCYEGHGRVGEDTRFNAFDVRKATWQSLLAGAKMGVTYGAHGIWSFHRRGMNFLNADRSFEPFDWDVALELPGGWDVGYARWLFETYAMFDLSPVDLLRGDNPEIQCAANPDRSKIAIYAPYAFDLTLAHDLSEYTVTAVNLETRQIIMSDVQTGPESTIKQHRFNTDTLYLATK